LTPRGNVSDATSQSKEVQLERSIGLSGGVALVVGGVVGAGVYILIAPIAAQAGSAIWMAFAIAIFVSLIGVLPVIQLAGALPRAGAGYLFASRLFSPFLGTMTSFWIVLGGGAVTCVVALTFAVYAGQFLPAGLPNRLLAILLVLAFYGLYQFGLRLAISLQILMAIQFLTGLGLYAIVGAFRLDLQTSVIPPQGPLMFVMAILLCYSTCMGFQVVAEMGEEIHNARRNIPLALILGGGIVAALFIMIGTVFVSSMAYDPEAYGRLKAPLSYSAGLFLPPAIVGLTSLNAAAIALPREIYAQARDGILPRALGRVHARTRTPQNSVTAYFIFVVVLLAAGRDPAFYSYAAAIGILVMSSVLCVASLRLPTRFPERAATAYIRFPTWLLIACTVITVLVSLGFSAVVALERPSVLVLYAGWSALVIAYYAWRSRRMTASDWEQIKAIPGTDETD
jgi:basic amino acid/polyamine antiporter, APA family